MGLNSALYLDTTYYSIHCDGSDTLPSSNHSRSLRLGVPRLRDASKPCLTCRVLVPGCLERTFDEFGGFEPWPNAKGIQLRVTSWISQLTQRWKLTD